MRKFLNLIKRSLFYERWTCNSCGKEIFGGYFCKDCMDKLIEIDHNHCNFCGRRTPYPVSYCDSCSGKNLSFDSARSVYEYTPVLSGVIQNFKYNNARYHARFFAEKLFEIYKDLGVSVDVVTFVPLSEKREKDRGYNQSKLIAKEFCKLSGVELLDCVFKIRETDSQAKLNFEGRVKNLKGAFKADKKLVKNRSVLLIDDVLTTGSTANAVSKALKSAGATKVTVLTVASISKTVFYD